MAFGGDIDTLNLLFDKLRYIFIGYEPIRESFLEINGLYKQGKISDRDYFEKLYESINRFSALEFLLIKAIFEMKKTLDKSSRRGKKLGLDVTIPGKDTPSSSPSIASFITSTTLPQAKLLMRTSQPQGNICSYCGILASKVTKYCTNCGKKMLE